MDLERDEREELQREEINYVIHARDDRDVIPPLASYKVGEVYPMAATKKELCVAKYGEFGLYVYLFLKDTTTETMKPYQSGSSVSVAFSEIADVGFLVFHAGNTIFECPLHPSISVVVPHESLKASIENGKIPVSLLLFNTDTGILMMIRRSFLSVDFTKLLYNWLDSNYDSAMSKEDVQAICNEVYGSYDRVGILEQAQVRCSLDET